MARGDVDGAITSLEKAVAQSPKSAAAHYSLATAYGAKAQGGNMLNALSYGPKMKSELETAVALDPKHAEARFALVELYAVAPPAMGGSPDKALSQAAEIKRLDPILGHRAFAFVYARQDKLDLARREYLDAIREQPSSAKAHTYFGMHLASREKNNAAAFAEFNAALKADPTYMPAHYYLGRTAALGDTNLAAGAASLKKYLAYRPHETEPPIAMAYYYQGLVYEKQGDKAAAVQSYNAALAINPTLKQASDALKRL